VSGVRIGIDLGGTKIDALAIDAAGTALARRRVRIAVARPRAAARDHPHARRAAGRRGLRDSG